MKLCTSLTRTLLVVALGMMAMLARGQMVRTSYFMDGAQYRLQLNPALPPDRGFVNLPAVGCTGVSSRSDVLSVDDVVDILKNGGDDEYYIADDFYNKLDERNKATVGLVTDLISVGWWHGKGFMSLNVSIKGQAYASVPRELFAFMRDMKGRNSNDYTDYYRDMSDEELNIGLYTEIGAGYTRRINDRLSIGGRVKCLLGQGNVSLKVGTAVAQSNLRGVDPEINWSEAGFADVINARGTGSIDIQATLETSAEGLELPLNEKGYIDHARFKARNMGVAGVGAAIDLGIACHVSEAVELSAAVTDLGFINWYNGCTQVAHSNTSDLTFDSRNIGDLRRFSGLMGSGEAINLHLARFTPVEPPVKKRRTMLASTLAVGGRCWLSRDRLSVGALYTDRFSHVADGSELTLSLNWHPRSLFELSLSYSPIQCGGSSVGCAVKAGPLFVGTDYIYLGSKTKCFNALVGLSIPLGRRQ